MKYGTPTGAIEKCSVCSDELLVDDLGRIPTHQRVTGRSFGDQTWTVSHREAGEPCLGFGRPSDQERKRRQSARDTDRVAELEAVRADAAVALDSFLSGRSDFAHRHDEFRKLALFDYRRRLKPHVRREWHWVAQRLGWTHRRDVKGDVYCIFCGEMLLRNVRRSDVNHPQIGIMDLHLTRCMLMFVAGIRDAVPPGTKMLPEEYRADA